MYKKNIYIDTFFKGMPSNKTNNIELYSSYITYVLNGLTKCLKFHFEKPFRKLKFTTYIFKQKTMNELCKQITKKSNINDNKKVLIGFGNWSSQKDSIIRGHRRGPVVGLKRELKKWCKLVLVDEYNTSKLCCKCHTKTEKISYNNIKINSVLRCTNNECRIVIDRDINGCKNIYNIFKRALEKKSRPKAFCRETNTS
jgi:transposase